MRVVLSLILISSAIAQTGGPTATDWPHYGGTQLSWRFSSLAQIDTSNVKSLAPAWIFQTGDYAENLQSTPIVVDGTMYLINTNYLTMRVHEEAQWEVIDFVPLTPVNQIGFLGLVFIVLALTLTKPKSCAVITTSNWHWLQRR